jgi:hypothetical protein
LISYPGKGNKNPQGCALSGAMKHNYREMDVHACICMVKSMPEFHPAFDTLKRISGYRGFFPVTVRFPG